MRKRLVRMSENLLDLAQIFDHEPSDEDVASHLDKPLVDSVVNGNDMLTWLLPASKF